MSRNQEPPSREEVPVTIGIRDIFMRYIMEPRAKIPFSNNSNAVSASFINAVVKWPRWRNNCAPLLSRCSSCSSTLVPQRRVHLSPPTCVESSNKSSSITELGSEGVRVNKCFTSFASRRQSDQFIQSDRVMINGVLAQQGARVVSGDVVTLDGKHVDWERLALLPATQQFFYVKHWKRKDVLCTTDDSIDNNILREVKHLGIADRLFPVGRLDESSTGLMILTSDGRLPNKALGASNQCTKKYIVSTEHRVSDEDVAQLRVGIVITSENLRNGIRKKQSWKTFPCEIERVEEDLVITLHEGRNRQIRKMLGALRYSVTMIHRIGFMGISLKDLDGPGDSRILSDLEMKLVEEVLSAVPRKTRNKSDRYV